LEHNRVELAHFFPRYGQWNKGRAVLEKLLQDHPDDHWVYFQLAVLQLYLHDTHAYRRTAEAMLQRFEFGELSEPDQGQSWRTPRAIMDRTAKVGLLLPPEKTVARLCETARRVRGPERPDEPLESWYAISGALAEYRAGNFDAAENRVRSLVQDGDPANERTIAATLISAMAASRLGRPQDAANRLASANQRLDNHMQQVSGVDADRGNSWADWLICEILRREAEGVVVGNAQTASIEIVD
jgi:hypothetical protein